MRIHTNGFKENISKLGREIDFKITYTINGTSFEIEADDLNSASLHYKGAILKSVMRQLDIDVNINIPLETTLNCQFGIKVNGIYEYINLGSFIVYSVKKTEDTNSFNYVCYDKMLYAMKDYENSDIIFPITVKDYLEAICEKVGLEYEGSSFANSDKTIANELFLDTEGRAMNYTFRDVLDEIAQVSGGTICINKDDKLEVRYVKDVGELVNVTGSSLTLETDSEVELDKFELEGKTEQDGEPTPDNPSELVSVGIYDSETGKYGIEVKTTGKNLHNGVSTNKYAVSSIGEIRNGNARDLGFENKILVQPNTTYTVKFYDVLGNYSFFYSTYDNNNNFIRRIQISSTNGTATFTTDSETHYIFGWLYSTSDTFTTIGTNIQIEQGTQATDYEEYKSNTYLYTLDNQLRSIGDTKDLLYIKNGMLYVERKIKSITLNGSENWRYYSSAAPYGVTLTDNKDFNSDSANFKSNYFENKIWNQTTFVDYNSLVSSAVDKPKELRFRYADITSLADFKSWLSTHNTEVQYILAEPYTEEIGQVDIPSTYKGITYLNTTDELEPNMNISYISEIETIDEEYLKDVNVNFGENFGKVNTIVLSRGGDGDKISLSIPSDLADEDKVAIQITDNQIMNGNDRNEYMSAILNKLYGLEYYINDFTSTGICYLDLCDRYNIKIGDNIYKCIMFNDEVNITQGLQESIYTDMQEENQQEYKYMSSTDRGITQANIIAKKNEATIVEYTQKVDEANNRLNAVKAKQTDTDRTISIISTNIDTTTGDINSVTTKEKRFTFNDEGLNVSSSDNTFKSRIDEQGVFFEDGNSRVAEYTKDGSKQKDLQLFGVYYYGMSDIQDTPMFVAQLYTDNNGEECFGHFYNGGDY